MVNINLKSTALICIDMQKGVFAEGGTLPHVGTDEVLPKAKKVLAVARQAKIPIIHVKEVHRKEMVDFGRELDGTEPVHCLETWSSTEFYWELAPIDGEERDRQATLQLLFRYRLINSITRAWG